MNSDIIQRIEIWPVDIPITDPFVVATGARVTAQNLFMRVTLKDGTHGVGEAAPFPEVGGEDRASCLAAAQKLAAGLIGHSAGDYETLADHLTEQAPLFPAARCGLETALLDAYCRSQRLPLWQLWGKADVRERETDITIPICDLDKTLALSRGWYAQGFRLFKMKVGTDVEEDIRRLQAVHEALPGISFIGDGNQGFSREDCIHFAGRVKQFGGRLILLEQPVVRDDLEGLHAIRHLTGIPVAADESVRSLDDARRVVRMQAADYINIKIMKTGVIEARRIADFTRSSGLRLMVGGMLETRIAMGCSFSLVLGLGDFDVLDLDTPLLLSTDPVIGGYRYQGPRLLPWQEAGLNMQMAVPTHCLTIQ
ncbi:MAG TPA: dipeptide epimerase [Nitrospira sp.]|nr:dipeptide epimerase [Nitrospira sp.]HNA85884.1 dipeptide epimerase [Nitrospira sp.]HNC83176.1 dipeptide epimerase [Nitrospira sp.]HNI19287.1 dipeptide epimerase [Nitrospira sp.]HNK47976.1 dipeptide epimerase [Nitrospira sp.]